MDVVGLTGCRPARALGLEPWYLEFVSGVQSVQAEHSSSLLLRLVRNMDVEVGVQEAWWRARQIGGSILVDFRVAAGLGRLAAVPADVSDAFGDEP